MELRCPNCRLLNPPETVRCDCGWEFAAGQLSADAVGIHVSTAVKRARASWFYPLIAWASQIILALALRGWHVPGIFWLSVMVIQAVLILVGFFCGARVLALRRSTLPVSTWATALIGVLLSGGTIIFIVVLSILDAVSWG